MIYIFLSRNRLLNSCLLNQIDRRNSISMTSLYAPSAEDVMKRLRPFGLFFEKSLKDLIKGIRANSESPEQLHQFLIQALAECREEANSPDLNLKTNSVLKLTYLEMYGFDMSWANFHVLEVMSSSKLQHKRVGYLAASQSFHKDPDILMLATNLLKKDLKYDGNNDTLKMGIALSGLSNMITPSLASDICDDLFAMLGSSHAYIRKKSVTALFKLFLQYPEALRDNFDSFVAKLEDDDLSVVSATVSVVCELSKKKPEPFIPLSPLFYEMLINIDNNWIIIRLLKLFTNLSQVEPKLRTKILPKVLELMSMTSAISVIYESINCIVKGHMLDSDDYDTALSCLQELTKFCNSNDPNLRYISVVLFYKIGKINTDFISEFDSLVIRLLKDPDVSIRSRALELLEGAVDEGNIKKIVEILIGQFTANDTVFVSRLGEPVDSFNPRKEVTIDIPLSYKVKMVQTISRICSMDDYVNISDFGWYIAVLSDLCVISQDLNDESLGYQLGEDLRNIMVKVPSKRDRAVRTIIGLISNKDIVQHLPAVLKECFWCIGEYSSLIENGDDLLRLIIKERKYSADIEQVLIQSLIKVFSNWCNRHENIPVKSVKDMTNELIVYLESLSFSKSFEVQERSVEYLELLKLCSESLDMDDNELPILMTEVLPSLFDGWELKPISHGTQRKLQRNLSLDLETPFLTEDMLQELIDQDEFQEGFDSLGESDAESDNESETFSQFENKTPSGTSNTYTSSPGGKYELEEKRRRERMDNPFYLDEKEDDLKKKDSLLIDFDDNESVVGSQKPSVIRLSVDDGVEKKKQKSKKKKKHKKVQVLSDEVVLNDDGKDDDELSDSRSLSSGKASNSKINLKLQTKLETFDFSRPQPLSQDASDVSVEGKAELEKLRAKFAQESLHDGDPDEEVIVIKKKKKKSKKKQASSKKEKMVEEGV